MQTFMIILSMESFAEKAGQFVKDGIALINDALENSIGTTLIEMIIQLFATLFIFLIVRFLIWNKVTAILEERKKVVRDALDARDKAINEANMIKEEAKIAKANSEKEAVRIIDNAKKRGYNEAEAIIGNANEMAKLKINNANEEIERMKTDSEAEIKKEIVEVAYAMASKIVEKEIEEDKYDLPLSQFIKDAKGNN